MECVGILPRATGRPKGRGRLARRPAAPPFGEPVPRPPGRSGVPPARAAPPRPRGARHHEPSRGDRRMSKTTGDVIVERLLEWGVDTAFGLPGDGINGIFESLRQNKD